MPKVCACGKNNDFDHALCCPLGGYTYMRHNVLRNTEATLLEAAGCKDIVIEPPLIPLRNNENTINGNSTDGARSDISARGVWNLTDKVFLDVRVTHPNAPSYRQKSLDQLYQEHETQKKREYNDRIINHEHASFTPLVFTTSGGMGPECTRFNQRIAELIAAKRKETYADVLNFVRTKLRFALLRSVLAALRGFRGRRNREEEVSMEDISFNLIPTALD